MAEAIRPTNWRFNPTSRRWEIASKAKGNPNAAISDAGLWIDKVATIGESANVRRDLDVGSLASLQQALVKATGTV